MSSTETSASVLGPNCALSVRVNAKRLFCYVVLLFSVCLVDAIPASRSFRTDRVVTTTRSLLTNASMKWRFIQHNPNSVILPASSATSRRPTSIRRHRNNSPGEATTLLQDWYGRPSILPVERRGLNFEFCCDDSDCRGSRVCEGFDTLAGDVGPCSFATEFCRCLPLEGEDQFCETDEDCPNGEICAVPIADRLEAEDKICISALSVPSAVVLAPVNESVVLLSGEPCVMTSQCAGRRVCEEVGFLALSPGPECSPASEVCLCRMPRGPVVCDFDDDCLTNGEVCAVVFITGQRVCVSKALADGSTLLTHQGLTGEFCFADRDCLGRRKCLSRDGSECIGDCICTLRNPVKCRTKDDCIRPLEICARSRVTGTQECVSQLAAKGSQFFEAPATPQPPKAVLSGMIPPSLGPMPLDEPIPPADLMTEIEAVPSNEFISESGAMPSSELTLGSELGPSTGGMPCDD